MFVFLVLKFCNAVFVLSVLQVFVGGSLTFLCFVFFDVVLRVGLV